MALARSTKVRNWSSGKSWNHQAFWDWHCQKQQAEERGTWQPARKAEPVEYRFKDGESFYIAVGLNLLWVAVRRMEIPSGNPGYRVKPDGGAEIERDEKTLMQQYDAAAKILRSIPLQRKSGRNPAPQTLNPNCGSAIGWHFQLVLSGFRPGPGSFYLQ